jgi:chromosome segregation ATPase
MGAVQDYRVNTDIVLHLKQENAAMEEKMGILKNEVTKNKDIIDNLRFDIEKTEKLLSLMYINNSNLRIENQKQIGEIEDRKKEMQKIEKEYKDREEKIKEKEEYIHARQIDQEVIQRRLNLTEKRLNNLKEELLFNKT